MNRLGAWIEVHDLAADGSAEAGWLAQRANRLAVAPGALGVQQWRSIDDPRVAVLTCDLQQPPAPGTADAAPTLRVRYLGEQILPGTLAGDASAGGLLLLAMDVDARVESEFNDWNDTEHFPRLAAVAGVLSARRIRCVPPAQKYLAVYHATRPDVIDSDAWLTARETPWARRIRTFTSRRMRIVCRRVGAAA